MRSYYIAINDYRSSTDDGFANTWRLYHCTREQQRRLLADGLPVKDECLIDDCGALSPCYSTNGIRTLTPAERSLVARQPHLADTFVEF